MTDTPRPSRWDLVCRIVDNLGDAAVIWRLARQLSIEHGCRVRLMIDQPAVLQQLVPSAAPGRQVDGVQIESMPDEAGDASVDVVVTGFHAALPPAYRRSMAPQHPVWVNLEYLSAEDWITDFHRLPSPQPDGLTEHYFYPGFAAFSGGLLREADLIARRDVFQKDPANRRRFLASHGIKRQPGETIASLLCYPDAPLDALAHRLTHSRAHLHLVVPQGAAAVAADVQSLAGSSGGRMRISRIPFLPQQEYDQLLWSCDLNFVRGEDSVVRAIWAARPFVWQIYVQSEAAHLNKLEAFLRLLGPGPLADAMRWWNRAGETNASALVELLEQPARAASSLAPLRPLATYPDLTSRLLAFVASVIRRNLPAVDKTAKL